MQINRGKNIPDGGNSGCRRKLGVFLKASGGLGRRGNNVRGGGGPTLQGPGPRRKEAGYLHGMGSLGRGREIPDLLFQRHTLPEVGIGRSQQRDDFYKRWWFLPRQQHRGW